MVGSCRLHDIRSRATPAASDCSMVIDALEMQSGDWFVVAAVLDDDGSVVEFSIELESACGPSILCCDGVSAYYRESIVNIDHAVHEAQRVIEIYR